MASPVTLTAAIESVDPATGEVIARFEALPLADVPRIVERARYNPALQRFIREDPVNLSSGLNLYTYTNNDPLDFIDRLGLTPAALGPTLVQKECNAYHDCKIQTLRKKLPGAVAKEITAKSSQLKIPAPNASEAPKIPSMDLKDYINANLGALLDAMKDCFKEHPLAGLDPRFHDLDVGVESEPTGFDKVMNKLMEFF